MLFFISSCATSLTEMQTQDTSLYHKREMKIKLNGKKFYGVKVVELENEFKIKGMPESSVEHLTIFTCHREYVEENVGKRFKHELTLTKFESMGHCPIQIIGLDKKGAHSWAYIAIRKPHEKMVAKVECNGEAYLARGLSVCQSRAGLKQAITFDEPVKVNSENDKCINPESADGKNWTYKLSRKECLFVFNKAKEIHRHIALGYDRVNIRSL